MKAAIVFSTLCMFLLFSSCNDVEEFFAGPVDPLIDAETVEAQDYDLQTPYYGMQVAIKSGVSAGTSHVLSLLDNRARQFLDCLFEGGEQLGFEDVELSDGAIVPPLSELRVYVVPNRFECEAEGRSVCGGIYFPGLDAIVIAEGGFEGCGEFSVWKHELGHRYGMASDHSNQNEFEPCINPDNCNPGDIFD